MPKAIACHDALLSQAVALHQGRVVKAMGDGIYAVFDDPLDALAAAVAIQRAVADPEATAGIALPVRCAVHAGVAKERDGDYFGDAVNRAARLMAASHGRQIVVSDTVCAATKERLPADVTLHGLGTVRLRDYADPATVYQLHAPGLKAKFPELRTAGAAPHNLPALATSFVGRERSIAEVAESLLSARLATIIGPGGIGKTRLAIELARSIHGRFDDGACLVELGSLADAELLSNAVGKALGIPEEPGQPPIETLKLYLHPRRLLLILDNCEHLLAACRELAHALLAAAPELRILATSRAPLNAAEETTHSLPSLSLPDEHEPVDVLRWRESVRLFHDRVALRKPRFRIDEATAPAVGQICRRLDGIPLAIELAAARAGSMSVDQVAQRLEDRFALLVGGAGAPLPRQQTLHALIDWSYELLSAPQKALFESLAVFSGGWTLDAAERIGSEEPTSDIAALLNALVEQSLVTVDPNHGRYRILETIRDYAARRLAESASATSTRARHTEYFVALAEQAEPLLQRGGEQARWLATLELEHDNMRAALAQSLGPAGDARQASRLCAAVYRFWVSRGHLREGRAWCERATTRDGSASTLENAKASHALGALAYRLGDLDAAQAATEHALVASRSIGDRELEARASINLAIVAKDRREIVRARELYEQAAALARAIDDKPTEVIALGNLGHLCVHAGEAATGSALLERALALCRELGDQASMAYVLTYLEAAADYQGNIGYALALNEEVRLLAQEMEDPLLIVQQRFGRAELLVKAGDLVNARRVLAEVLPRIHDLDDAFMRACSLDAAACVAIAVERYGRAAVLIGAADATLASIESRRPDIEQSLRDRRIAACRAALGDVRTEESLAAGGAAPLEATIDATLRWLSE